MNEQFPKWILGVASAAVISIGAGLLTTMVMLREDMAVVKSHIAELKQTNTKVDAVERIVIGHEYRITALEADGTVYRTDTIRARRGR